MTFQRVALVGLGAVLMCAGCKAVRSGETPTPKTTPVAAVSASGLSESVEKGLLYLVNQQQDDGGWGQGGGWRSGGAGRIQEGAEGYKEQSDVGNTAMATLALIRTGSTAKSGPYADQISRGIHFICASVEASNGEDLYVTDVRGTQIQRKIGTYADTFLSALILSEVRGHMASAKTNDRVDACLTKTIAKIESNQKEDGTYADNQGWASVLSQGLSTKSLNRARQLGVPVSDEALERVQKQVTDSYDIDAAVFHRSRQFKPWILLAQAGATKKAEKKEDKRGGTNAGVGIYSNSANLAGMAETVKTNEQIEFDANEILGDLKAPESAKIKAREDLKRAAEAKRYYQSARDSVISSLDDPSFIAGFGSAGGEEYLSYMNISETLAAEGGESWTKWNTAMSKHLAEVQNEDGSWAGHHCITGRTFVTSAALLTLMADRAPVVVASAEK